MSICVVNYGTTAFQFTHPGKGATTSYSFKEFSKSFNSRTLGRVRPLLTLGVSISLMFQFTHPGKGATVGELKAGAILVVSIHAPWEGCDSSTSASSASLTHVSIHAPWEGCDSRSVSRSGREGSFNSRTLGRVRPVMFVLLNVSLPCFNSRTLGRVRPRRGRFRAASRSFNSRTLGRVRQRLICCC